MRTLSGLLALAWLLAAGAVPTHAACTVAADCDDGNNCTTDVCNAGTCEHTHQVACGPVVSVPVPVAKLQFRIPPPNPTNKGVKFLIRDAVINLGNLPLATGPSDPTFVGGSVRFVSTAAGFDETYPLPFEHWEYFPQFSGTEYRGYQYKDVQGQVGPVGYVKLKGDNITKLKAKGAMGFNLSTNPQPVTIVLTLGNHRYCAEVGGARWLYKTGTLWWGKGSLAPAACP